jgi:hypothetical protein
MGLVALSAFWRSSANRNSKTGSISNTHVGAYANQLVPLGIILLFLDRCEEFCQQLSDSFPRKGIPRDYTLGLHFSERLSVRFF